jgi:DNA invertase Pin-like site-specific DNA recombinase
MTIYAYARISIDKQNIEMQLDALKNYGYDHFFSRISTIDQKLISQAHAY